VDLSVEQNSDPDGQRRVLLSGSLDLATKAQLIEASQGALTDPAKPNLVFDMAGVTFMDSTGIGALIQISNAARVAGIGFSLDRPSEKVSRILTLTGLQDRWSPASADPAAVPGS
jgi:anti-sigma B factor antagonist